MADIVGVRITLAADIDKQAMTASLDDRVRIAEVGADEIVAQAPYLTGSFREHVAVERHGDQVAVVDNDPGAEWIEYGNSHQPAHATMVQVLSQFGKYSGVRPRGRR